MRAADVVPDDLLRGDHHTVDDVVRSDGYLNYYAIQSEYGEFDAVSTQMLRTRIGEINALAELDELTKTEVFAQAAVDAGVGQIKAIKQFATNPVETVVGIPSGIGRMFKRFKRQAGYAVDTAQETMASEDEQGEDSESSEDEESTTDKAVGLTESFMTRCPSG